MSVTVLKRPYNYCFSGNPVAYELYSTLAATDNTVQLELRVQFKAVDGAYTVTDPIPFAPVGGAVKADISEILESLLTYELPTFDNELALQPAPGHTGLFYLQFREVSPTNANTTWDDSEASFACLVLKGGMSRFKYQGNNFWVNYFQSNKPFLTWQERGRMAALTERMYLLFLNTIQADSISAEAKVFFVDGTSATTTATGTAAVGQCVYIPAGAAQWQLQNLAAKKIWYWEITVYAGSIALTESFRFYADNRNDYNATTLHYRGSLGGLDSVRIRGDIEQSLTYENQKIAVTQQPDYYTGPFYAPQQRIAANSETQTWTGDIGYLSKEEQDRLRDAFLQRETWWAVDSKWWPVNITTQKNTLRKSSSQLFSMPIEWTLAHEGDAYYTPQHIETGSAVFESNVCQAFVSDITVVITDSPLTPGFKKATITFTENDPQNASTQVRYQYYSDDASQGWQNHDYSPIEILVEDNKITTLELQGICSNNIYGKLTSYQIDTTAAAAPPDTGGGSTAVSRTIYNHTNFSTAFAIYVDGVYVQSGFLAANSSATFLCPDLVNQKLEVKNMGFAPASSVLTANQQYYGSYQSNVITFTNVTASDPFKIDFY